jgi:hypothetical protein
MKVKKRFNIFLQICGDIRARSLTFRGLSAESLNFPQPRKGMPFRGIILGNYSRITVHAFPRIIPRKGMPFRGIIFRKSKLSVS